MATVKVASNENVVNKIIQRDRYIGTRALGNNELECLAALTRVADGYGLHTVQTLFNSATKNMYRDAFSRGALKGKSYGTCILKLEGKRCRIGYEDGGYHKCLPDGFDHSEIWTWRGRAVAITTQPYGIRQAEVDSLSKYCSEHGLSYEIRAEGWHNPMSCPLLVVWSSELREEFLSALQERIEKIA